MERATRAAILVIGAVVLMGLAATYLPAVVWPDAAAPPTLAASLPSARRLLWAEATDGFPLPIHFRFVEARCGSGGSVALIFEEHRLPYLESSLAYLARGSKLTVAAGAWSGGFGIVGSVQDDDELIHLMGTDTKACEA